MNYDSTCPVCKFECHPEQVKNFGMCVVCVVAKSYGFNNMKVPQKPITINDIIDAHQLMQSDTVTLAQLGLAA